MAWNRIKPLTLLWWNTGLTPPTAKKSNGRLPDRPFAADQIKLLRKNYKFDVLGLAEVSEEDLEFILRHIGDTSLAIVDMTNRKHRMKFDTAMIYDRTSLTLANKLSLTERSGRGKLKLGELVTFETVSTGDFVHVVASHWPSRRTLAQHSSKRAELGMRLRQSLEKVHLANPNPYIVLMGDYNDDPFSPSLSEHLHATRDRELAIQDSAFLYNPFWRRLGESQSFPTSGNEVSVCGTHYYAGGEFTRWVTFDQLIFSPAFLGDNAITLEEKLSEIIITAELKDRVMDKRQVFDHFPVSSVAFLRREI